MEPAGRAGPTITSAPATRAELGIPYDYDDDAVPTATGDEPRWWSLAAGPPGARADPATGAIEWTPASPGDYDFILRVDNDVSFAAQSFAVQVAGDATDAGPTPPPDSGPPEAVDGGAANEDDDGGGCGCALVRRSSSPSWALALFGLGLVALRTRRQGNKILEPTVSRASSAR